MPTNGKRKRRRRFRYRGPDESVSQEDGLTQIGYDLEAIYHRLHNIQGLQDALVMMSADLNRQLREVRVRR
jgi:hypothetical protein